MLFYNKFLILLIIVLSLTWINTSAIEYVPAIIDVTEWQITIWAPKTITFPPITTQASIQYIETTTLSWEYLWVEDLKSSSPGYYAQVSISDFSSTWWNVINKSNVQITTTWWITTLNWQSNTWIYIPSAIELWFQSLEKPLILIRRSTNSNWDVWKYWERIQ